jgi:hypothetical protein
MMTVAAARLLSDGQVCFVGIGLPSAACNLARLTHAPELVLIYESGTIGTRPSVLPLSIGDGELAETATCVIPLPDVFSDYLQAGRIDIGFLGAAQIDKLGNLNSTVHRPVRETEDPPAGRGRCDRDRGARARGLHRHEGDAAQLREADSISRPAADTSPAARRERRAGPRPVGHRHRRRHPETHPETGEFALSTVYPGIPRRTRAQPSAGRSPCCRRLKPMRRPRSRNSPRCAR